ncbi:MAG: peptidylprolyl isomerase [Clostridia bacterium]|nr:peptidylprolyl isomerase [Clostridia bacterium]
MKKTNIILIVILVVLVILVSTVGYGYLRKATMEVKNPIVTMEVANYGTIEIELYPEMAPETVANFVNLVENGFYDGLTFHRIIEGFMIQGGGNKIVEKDVTDETTGETKKETKSEAVEPKLSNLGIKLKKDQKDEEYCIKGEFLENGYTKNTLRHKEGVISMARADYTEQYSETLVEESYNSATAQFFIMTADNLSLDGNYAPFGKVKKGMEVVHAIEKAEVKKAEKEGEEESTPVENIIINKVTVDKKGVKYDKPHTLKPWDYSQWLYNMY